MVFLGEIINMPAAAAFRVKRVEPVAAAFGAGGTEELDIAHLRQRLHPGDAVTAVNPVVIPFHGNAGDSGVFQRLQGLDGAGKGTGEDLAGVEEVTGNQDEIDLFGDSVCHDAAKHTKEIFIALGFIGSGAVGFAEVDVGGMEKFDVFQ